MRNGLLTVGLVTVLVTLWCAPAHAAVSNPRVTRGAGNQLVLTYQESTVSYGLQWWLDGTAYSVTSRSPSDCTELSEHPGMICTFTSFNASGTVTVSMTTDKYVSPNTNTHLVVDSQGAEGQTFQVLVEGGGTPVTPTPTPTATPTPVPTEDPAKKQQKKDAAQADFENAVGQATANCMATGLGAGLVSAGLIGGAGSIGAGLPATVVGSLMVDAGGPLCGQAIQRILQDYKIVKDPPDPNFATLALPAKVKAVKPYSCRKAHKRGKRACARLAKAAAALKTATARAGAVRKAIGTTMDRTTGAVAASNAPGLALQDASHLVLAGMLAHALRAQNKAAAAFTKLLRHDRVRLRITGKREKQGLTRTIERIVAAGVPEADLRQLAGPALTPKSVDVVKHLAAPAPTADLTTLAHELTASAAASYLAVAAQQLHRTPAQARKQLTAAGAFLPG